MGVWMGQSHGRQVGMQALLMVELQNGTTSPHGSFRHQASCRHPLHRWTQAQEALAQQAAAGVKSHREGAYDLISQSQLHRPAEAVQPDPSSLLLRPSANRSCRQPSGPLIQNPLRDVALRQGVDQVACRQHHPPVDDRFQATDRISDHPHHDCASPDCAAAVENVHPSVDLNDAAAAANAPFANRLTRSTPHQLLGPKETNPSQS